MSASLRPAAPTGARQPASDPGQMVVSEQRPVTHGRHAHPHRDGEGRAALAGGVERPSSRLSEPERRPVGYERDSHPSPGVCAGWATLPGAPERLSGPAPARRRDWSGSRLGRRRGVAGLVAVCVLTLGVAACSAKDAKAEASASASASASAAIARAEKGIADANASATASREAALTPELRAKRDAALAEPAPAKPQQMNEESPEGAASSVRYFLELYRYAYMTGNTTELAAMSEDGCKFCQSVISNATNLHNEGGWNDKWEQNVNDIIFYEKLEGNAYNRTEANVSHGPIVSYPGGGKTAESSNPVENQILDFAIHYVNGRWMIGGVRVEEQ